MDGQAGLRLCCQQTPKDKFSRVAAHFILPDYTTSNFNKFFLILHLNIFFLNSIFVRHVNLYNFKTILIFDDAPYKRKSINHDSGFITKIFNKYSLFTILLSIVLCVE